MLRAAGLGLTLTLLFGCSNEHEDPGGAVVFADSPQCSSPGVCDIQATSCLQAVLELTACVRGEDAPPLPEIRRITSDELRSELAAEANAQGTKPSPIDAALRSLRLLPTDMTESDASIDVAVSAWAAYYDPETKRVTMLDGDVELDHIEAMYVLAHEFTHYMQDRSVDLQTFEQRSGRSADNQVATRSLIEGEAVVTATRASLAVMQHSPSELNWKRYFDLLDSQLLDEVAASSAPLPAAALTLPYSAGGRYVASAWNRYGRAHVAMLFEDAPNAMVDWLAGYGSGAMAPTLVEPLDCPPPLAPEGFRVYAVDQLGAAGALAMLAAANIPDLALARELRGDLIAIYETAQADEPSTAPVLTVWRLRFSNAQTAATFANALARSKFVTQLVGREVTISASSDPTQEALRGQTLATCAALDQLMPQGALPKALAAINGRLP